MVINLPLQEQEEPEEESVSSLYVKEKEGIRKARPLLYSQGKGRRSLLLLRSMPPLPQLAEE